MTEDDIGRGYLDAMFRQQFVESLAAMLRRRTRALNLLASLFGIATISIYLAEYSKVAAMLTLFNVVIPLAVEFGGVGDLRERCYAEYSNLQRQTRNWHALAGRVQSGVALDRRFIDEFYNLRTVDDEIENRLGPMASYARLKNKVQAAIQRKVERNE